LILGFIFCAYQELNSVVVNYEGKEYRHGMLNSIFWAVSSTATSNGSTNSLLESFSAIAGMIPLLFMLTGEVIFGGVGQGLYTLILYIFITIFIAGLMAGRMPEYLGKKIEVFEIKMTMLALLIPVLTILVFSAIAMQLPDIKQQLSFLGAKGFTELFYAFASTTGNNGSAFTGLKSNTVCLNIFFGITMLLGRYGIILPVLAIAGNLVHKSTSLEKDKNSIRASMVPTDSIAFIILLCGIILILSLLSFFPIILMGPIAEHFTELNAR
jgi:K+-transporting ATPase ATPase A chain